MNVYVIAASDRGPCKIGVAVDTRRRLRELQTASPSILSVLHSEPVGISANAVERAAHDLLRHKRSPADNEWFGVSSAEAVAAIKFAATILNLPTHVEKSLLDRQRHITLEWLKQKNDFEERVQFETEFSTRCPDILKLFASTKDAPDIEHLGFNDYILTWDEGPWLRWAFERLGKRLPLGKSIAPYLRADDYLETKGAEYGRQVALRWMEWSNARELRVQEIQALVATWNTYVAAYNTVFEGPEHDAHGTSDHIDDVHVYALRGDRDRKDQDKIVFHHTDFRAVLVPAQRVELLDFSKSIFGRLNPLPDIKLYGFVAPPAPTDIWERPLESWFDRARAQQESSFLNFVSNDDKHYPKIERHEHPFNASMAWRSLPCIDTDGSF